MLFTGSIYWGTVSGCIKYTLRKEKNEKVKLGIYLEEDEYRQRFTRYFMNHYKDQIEIYIYTDMEQLLQAAGGTIDVALAEETDCWNREDIPLVQSG